MTPGDSLIDTLFDGRYQIVRKLGAGGMADVYLAEDQELGRRVAIKILNNRHANDAQFIERFRREAKNAAALNHPNIVSIYDRGEAEHTYYIAMEFLDGRSLKELIIGRGPAPVNVAVEYVRQILSALRFAHRHGIVHRDIKPHNVLVDREGRVKVTDFGIARAGTSQMTEAGSIVGTAQYLSPEQARGGEVDQRSDLYSLGVVLYELLTGQTPFDGDTPVEIAMKHLSAMPRPPSQIRRRHPARPRHGRDARARQGSGGPLSERRRDGGRPRPRPARRAGGGGDDRLRDAGDARPGRRGGGRCCRGNGGDDDHAERRRLPGAPPRRGRRGRPRRERSSDVADGSSPALFVVAAAIAGIIVWHQLSGSGPQEPVGFYSDCVPLERARFQIKTAHLVPKVNHGATEKCPAGQVYDQDPRAVAPLPKGGTVTIWVSTGRPKVAIPDVVGETWPDARKALQAKGFKPNEHIVRGGKVKGIVSATGPAPGTKVTKGSPVRVNVTSGPTITTRPVRGRRESEPGDDRPPQRGLQRQPDVRGQQRAGRSGRRPGSRTDHAGTGGHDHQCAGLERAAAEAGARRRGRDR